MRARVYRRFMGALVIPLALLTVILTAICVVLLLALRKQAWRMAEMQRSSSDYARMWRSRYERERGIRKVYDRALGFPVQDDLLADEIWARAAHGDEIAEAILEESVHAYAREFEPSSGIFDL